MNDTDVTRGDCEKRRGRSSLLAWTVWLTAGGSDEVHHRERSDNAWDMGKRGRTGGEHDVEVGAVRRWGNGHGSCSSLRTPREYQNSVSNHSKAELVNSGRFSDGENSAMGWSDDSLMRLERWRS